MITATQDANGSGWHGPTTASNATGADVPPDTGVVARRAAGREAVVTEQSYQHLDWISPRPVLFITGDQAHSRLFSEHAYSKASDPKELFIVPRAGHVDLYDRVNLIPWDKLSSFVGTHLARGAAASSRVR